MRKSERLRLLEIEFVRLQMQVEILSSYISGIIESEAAHEASRLDSGKWYNRNPE